VPRASRRSLIAAIASLCCLPLLAAPGCKKEQPKTDPTTGAGGALDRSDADSGPVDKTPLAGVDVSKLTGDKVETFYKLVGSMKSPCGKSHSLRTSFTSDQSCKRAPFAVKYIAQMLVDEIPEAKVRELYTDKYEPPATPVKLDVSKAPHFGPTDAPVRLVEFYDYACPHCQAFAPQMAKVAADNDGRVVEYFMEYPLEGVPGHENSRSAAQASLAAAQLGKFKEMHEKLFAMSPNHTKEAVIGYATDLGMDAAKFTAAYDGANGQVSSDQAQGKANDVDSTPTLFFNDRRYKGPMAAEYIDMWIEEELAVNR
jgi:protein-disulfide isomerase